jgi:small subunit ribosomal protein S17
MTEQNETTENEAPKAAAEAAPAAAPREPVEVVPPKERRRRARAGKAAKTPTGKPRTPEERHADRVAERGQKAQARRTERVRAREKARASGAVADTIPAREHGLGKQKTRQGVVVSDKADKTITVRVDTARRHRRYKKIVRRHTTFHAHDEHNEAHEGDLVRIVESRPLSATKRWRLIEVVERAK